MVVTVPFSEVFEDAGSGVGKFRGALAKEVVRMSCDLWSLYPDWFTQNSLPATSFARGFMNQMCEPLQSPVPAPVAPNYTGGQCEGVQYRVTYGVRNWNPSNCRGDLLTGSIDVVGALGGISWRPTGAGGGTTNCDPSNPNKSYIIVSWGIDTSEGYRAFGTGGFVYSPDSPAFTSQVESVVVVRLDGQPDDCGNPPLVYPPAQPTVNDFSRTVNVEVNDGLDLAVDIQMISNNTTNNYPLHYRVNGVNVVVDFGGVHFYGSPNITSPDSLHDVPPPGGRPAFDPLGNPVTNIYNNVYLNDPEPPNDGTIEEIVQRIICTEGVLELVDVVIEIVAGNYPMLLLLLQLLNDVLKEICGIEATEEAIVALPEYWGAKPAIDRPAICYIWKEWDGVAWGRSTYSNTVPYPSDAAIAEIDSLDNISRTSGQFLATVTFDDGAKIRASGSDEAEAVALLNWYINKVDSSYVPLSYSSRIRITKNPTLQVKSLRLRQVEYYENGQTGNRSPSIKRRIDIE